MNSETAYKYQEMVQKGIDALIDMEGTVYHNGLPSELTSALRILRARERYLEAQGDNLKTEEDNKQMIASVVDGALAEQKRMTSMIVETHEFDEIK